MKPYLLAPAGSFEALTAAAKAGADEIYLGGPELNARMNASNFSRGELEKAAEYCHSRGISLHITLNTLVYDREFSEALRYVSFLREKVKPDALIIQDLGLICAVKREFPDICLHASTQMRIHSSLDIKYLRALGIKRAVLARELPREDIKEFASSGMETEIFVHGALCVCESGGCLMSSVIGNRSGNRGLCAQPCRLPSKGINGHPLSLKDLCLAGKMEDILSLGVTSLKIEGRMKSPDYVYGVVSVYRRLIDEGRNATEKEINLLKNIFSRDGFTDGYYTSHIGRNMFGFRSESDKKNTGTVSFDLESRNAETGVNNRKEAKDTEILPLSLPDPDFSKIQSPKEQFGRVLRFEGRLPSRKFFEKHAEDCVRIDIPIEDIENENIKDIIPFPEKIAVILPRQIYVSERETIKRLLKKAYDAGIRHAVVSAFYQIDMCEGFFVHGDYAFNIINRETLDAMTKFGFSSLMLSPECETKAFHGSKVALEYFVYGRTPLMYTRNCIIKNITDCLHGKRCIFPMTDRTGAKFPIIGGFMHRNTIYNSVPCFRLDRAKELKKSGIGLLTYIFTDETEEKIEKILKIKHGEMPDFAYTRR